MSRACCGGSDQNSSVKLLRFFVTRIAREMRGMVTSTAPFDLRSALGYRKQRSQSQRRATARRTAAVAGPLRIPAPGSIADRRNSMATADNQRPGTGFASAQQQPPQRRAVHAHGRTTALARRRARPEGVTALRASSGQMPKGGNSMTSHDSF